MGATSVEFDGKIYVFGGQSSAGGASGDGAGDGGTDNSYKLEHQSLGEAGNSEQRQGHG